MFKLRIFITATLLILLSFTASLAQQINGEVSIGVKGIKFKDVEGTKPMASFEFGNRWNNLGVILAIGAANIDSNRYEKFFVTYREELNYYPVELNVKGFIPLRHMEFGVGAGFSMNYLDFTVTNEFTDKEVQSKTNLLFGAQAMAELKFLFPSTTGLDAFVGLEAEYQYVGKTSTFLGDKDLSNYRLGIRFGGRF